MYKIIQDGEALHYVDKLKYIRKHDNGCFVEADAESAEGIVVNGTVYSLAGHELGGSAGEVIAVEVDSGAELAALQAKNEQLEAENLSLMLAVADIYEQQEEANTNLSLAIIEVYETILGG